MYRTLSLRRLPLTWSNALKCFSTHSTAYSVLLQSEIKNTVQWIRLNRIKQFNALNTALYEGIIDQLTDASNDENVKLVVLTGNGPFFSSGNDLNNFTEWQSRVGGSNFSEAVDFGCHLVERFVNAFIDFPKPIIGLVNGPSYGIMATILAHLDTVIASDRATFTTPFTSLGQAPEGCSTYLFPQILGPSVASEMLLFSRTMTVEDAFRRGFVSRIIPDGELAAWIDQWLYHNEKGLVTTCYPNSMRNAKSLVKNEQIREKLKRINAMECESLRRVFQSTECKEALEKFFARKKKK